MENPSADVFRRIALAGPDVIRHLGDGRDKRIGVMWVHGSKVSFCLCQSVAGGDGTKAVGQSGDDGFLILEAAFCAFAAFYGKAGYGYLIAYGRGILQGEDQ